MKANQLSKNNLHEFVTDKKFTDTCTNHTVQERFMNLLKDNFETFKYLQAENDKRRSEAKHD